MFGYLNHNQRTEIVKELRNNNAFDVDFSAVSGVLDVVHIGEHVSVTVENCNDETRRQLAQIAQHSLTETALNLDEIFEAYVVGNKGQMQLSVSS